MKKIEMGGTYKTVGVTGWKFDRRVSRAPDEGTVRIEEEKMNKKEKQKLADIVAEVVAKTNGKTITGCNFVGVQYDAKAVNAIETIATGLVETAKALGALAQVLKASNVELQALLRIDG